MHENITSFPRGEVVASARLVKGDQTIDVTRLRYGSRTRFVEKVTHVNRFDEPLVTSMRKTDDFPSDKIANRWINEWLQGITGNREYELAHKDPGFDGQDQQ